MFKYSKFGIKVLPGLCLILLLNVLQYSHQSFLPNHGINFRNSLLQLLAAANYRLVTYSIQTKDNYVVTLDRVVSMNETLNSQYNIHRKPILLIHGFLSTPGQFFINAPEINNTNDCENIGFCLLKTGRYDVWALNSRGNGVNNVHLSYDAYDHRYWDYTFDKVARYDLKSSINLILKETNRPRLAMLGYSIGTVTSLAFLTLNPDYAPKIHPLVLWAPIAYMGHINNFGEFIIPFMKDIVMKGRALLNPNFRMVNYFMMDVCQNYGEICNQLQAFIQGYTKSINESRWTEYLRFTPSDGSTSDLLHLTQLIESNRFRQFDYGPMMNHQMYGEEEAPEYPFKNIPKGFNVLLVHGRTDSFAVPRDVRKLLSVLKKLQINAEEYQVPQKYWNHLNFIAGLNASKLLNIPSLEYLNRFY